MRRRAGGHARRGCALADRERQWDLAAVRVRARGALGARRTVVVGAAGHWQSLCVAIFAYQARCPKRHGKLVVNSSRRVVHGIYL